MARCFTMCAILVSVLVALIAVLLAVTSPTTYVPPMIPENSSADRQLPYAVWRIAVAVNAFFEAAAVLTRPPHARIKWLATSYWQSEITYSLTMNGVIDAVGASGTATCTDVAAQLDLRAGFLCRIMSAGARLQLLALDSSTGQYSLTPTGDLLRKEHPLSLHSFVVFTNEETRVAWRAASLESLRTGESGFKRHFGVELWDWHEDRNNTKKAKLFDAAMEAFSWEISSSLLVAWAPPKLDAVVCDLGGGVGHILVAIAQHYPQLGGILFDLPPVAKRAAATFAESGLDGRLKTMGGSFLEPLPAQMGQCDVFYMKFIMPDWPDEECVTILRNIAAVAKRGATIVSTDFILDIDGRRMESNKRLADINMLAVQPAGAKERSLLELEALFRLAGLRAAPQLIKMRALVSAVVISL